MSNLIQSTMEKRISEKQFKLVKISSIILLLFSLMIWFVCIIGILKSFDLWLFIYNFPERIKTRGSPLIFIPLWIIAALSLIILLLFPLGILSDLIKKPKSYSEIPQETKAVITFNDRCKMTMGIVALFVSIIISLYSLYPSSYHKSWVWFYSFGTIGSIAVFKKAVGQNLKGEKFSVQTIIDFVIEMFKLCLLFAFILIALKSDAAVQSMVRILFGGNNTLKSILEIVKLGFVVSSMFPLVDSILEYENSFTDAKHLKKWLWAIVALIIAEFLFVVFCTPSNGDIMQLISLGISQMMKWSLPLLLLFIAFLMSAKFPSGKEIYEDIQERRNRRNKKAIEEVKEILAEKEPVQNSNSKE